MVLPRYIETEWSGQGKAVLKFCSKRGENDVPPEKQATDVGKIECYVSSLYIREYESRLSAGAEGGDDVSQHCMNSSESEMYKCPSGVQPEVWQSWLVHWDAWKDIYIPLSWVHKHRKLCTSEYIEWHDTYLEKYPFIKPFITDELGNSDTELESDNNSPTDQNNYQKDLDIEMVSNQANICLDMICSHEEKQKICKLNAFGDDYVKPKDECKTYDEQDYLESELGTGFAAELNHKQKDPSQNLTHKNVSKEDLDALYEKHSEKRYWVHCRSFLYSCDVHANSDIDELFTQKAGIQYDKCSLNGISEQGMENNIEDENRIMNYIQEQGMEIEAEDDNKTIDDIDDQGPESKDEVDMNYSQGLSWQKPIVEINDIRTVEQNKKIEEPVKIQHSLKSGADKLSHGVFNNFNDEQGIQYLETCQHDDIEKDITEHRQNPLPRENSDECNGAGEQFENTKSKLINVEPALGESRNVHDFLKDSGTKQLDRTTDDDSKSDSSTSRHFASKQCDKSELIVQVPTDGEQTKNYRYDRSILTTSSFTRKATSKKKKKKNSSSCHSGGLSWALKYIQSQLGENEQNIVEDHSLEAASLTVSDAIDNTNNEIKGYIFKDLNLSSNQTPCKSDIYDTSQADVSECLAKRNVGNIFETSASQGDANFDILDRHKESNMCLQTSAIQGVGDCAATDYHETSNVCLCTESPEDDSDDDREKTWNPSTNIAATVKSFAVDSAFHFLSVIFPVISGNYQQPIPVPWLASPSAALPCESQQEYHHVDNYEERVKKKCKSPEEKSHRKLFQWLQPHAYTLSTATTINVEEGVMLNKVYVYPDHREVQRVYQSVEESVREDGTVQVNMEILDLVDDNSQIPERRERSLWKEMISGHKLVSYGKTEELPPHDMPQELHKYWAQRHRLFIRYDEGILLDQESWYSVTPEMIAAHHAYRCRCDVVVDAFCGTGGNAVQLAKTCNHVIAIDIDPAKIDLARHNAAVYGVAGRIEFIIGDFFHLVPELKADVVYLSPPWGGTEYLRDGIYDVESLDGVLSCEKLMAAARTISTCVALYLPKNSDLQQVIELAGVDGAVDIEYSHMGRKKKALTAYYGDLVHYY